MSLTPTQWKYLPPPRAEKVSLNEYGHVLIEGSESSYPSPPSSQSAREVIDYGSLSADYSRLVWIQERCSLSLGTLFGTNSLNEVTGIINFGPRLRRHIFTWVEVWRYPLIVQLHQTSLVPMMLTRLCECGQELLPILTCSVQLLLNQNGSFTTV